MVTGGTGLVGGRLLPRLLERGDQVLVVTRAEKLSLPAGCTSVAGDVASPGPWLDRIAECDAVVHLAGENVFARRWRSRFKQRIRDSRVNSTRLIAEALAKQPRRSDGSPKVLVSASAVGFYGFHGRDELDEESPPGSDFLAVVCMEWEKAAQPAKAAGVRVCHLRIGMVLDDRGGGLPKLVRPFKWFMGGAVGSGEQWISWIHVEDLVGLILFALDRSDVAGLINATAPEPMTNWGFCKMLGTVLRRPCWLPVPAFAVRLLLGQVAAVVTKGQRVIPRRALSLGYSYQYPDLEPALRDLLQRPAHSKVVENKPIRNP
jgi:uncharacterized protein (TIGR01777 family)